MRKMFEIGYEYQREMIEYYRRLRQKFLFYF
jgi:hypothetical protein